MGGNDGRHHCHALFNSRSAVYNTRPTHYISRLAHYDIPPALVYINTPHVYISPTPIRICPSLASHHPAPVHDAHKRERRKGGLPIGVGQSLPCGALEDGMDGGGKPTT